MTPKIIIISGKQGSGKTTLAEALKKALGPCVHMKFADPLYDMHNFIRSQLTKYKIEMPIKDRRLLQWLGTEYVRSLDENAWAKIARQRADFFINGGSNVVIDDCRFLNELEIFPDAIKIRLECPQEVRAGRAESYSGTEHPSETALDAHLGKFHHIVPTHTLNEQQVLETVLETIKQRNK